MLDIIKRCHERIFIYCEVMRLLSCTAITPQESLICLEQLQRKREEEANVNYDQVTSR